MKLNKTWLPMFTNELAMAFRCQRSMKNLVLQVNHFITANLLIYSTNLVHSMLFHFSIAIPDFCM